MNFQTKRVVNTSLVFLKRDLKERYAHSILGPIWIILYPLILMGVVATIFSVAFSNQIEEIPYALFALIGFVHWLFFSQSISHLTRSFLYQKTLIANNKFPLISLPISILLSRFIDYLVGLLLIIILFLTLHQFSFLALTGIILLVFLQGLMQLGLGLILAIFNSFYKDVQYVVDIGLQILFYVTPVIYSFNLVPKYLQPIMNINPLLPFFRNYHQLFIEKSINMKWLAISVLISIVFLLLGLFTYKKYRYKVPELI